MKNTLKAGSRCKIGILTPQKGCFKVGQLDQILGFLKHYILKKSQKKVTVRSSTRINVGRKNHLEPFQFLGFASVSGLPMQLSSPQGDRLSHHWLVRWEENNEKNDTTRKV
jgi:hypothetical protein